MTSLDQLSQPASPLPPVTQATVVEQARAVAEVQAAVQRLRAETPDLSRLILSCAGGMPPGASTENLKAFIAAARG